MNIYGYPPETKQEKVTVLIRLSLLKDKEIEQHIMTLLKNVNTESEIEEALQTVKRANKLITKYNVTSDNWSIYDKVIHQMQRIEEVTKEIKRLDQNIERLTIENKRLRKKTK